MCCFSQHVISVRSTNIFARPAAEGRQALVYSMTPKAKTDLAMILPLPVKTPADELDLEFVNLREYPNFFADLDQGFPNIARHGDKVEIPLLGGSSRPKLKVISVGSFEASFVPTVADFSRLDERFRLPSDVWGKLPDYKDYGFAVFKLKPGEATVHPMAFYFRRRDLSALFFPTVHIHDGTVHAKAHFDHALYCQPTPDERPAVEQWKESYTHPLNFMQIDKTRGLVLKDQHCYKKEMRGSLPNRDTLLKIG